MADEARVNDVTVFLATPIAPPSRFAGSEPSDAFFFLAGAERLVDAAIFLASPLRCHREALLRTDYVVGAACKH
ncbi:hypothetical protein GN958_ATG13966 [Phytophthora infestans]|uniref:Uncharacterized protein n=1 Tax=Phytophthora infestans TaxID=4787 RepID=A0A8S9UB82_PHYIN|nr:hypothetical protein GN958_ATG13966 [Phytophthora infestans]